MNHCYPILSIADAREYEKSVLGDDLETTAFAMEQAGLAIGEGVLRDYAELQDWPLDASILVLAGKGLNSGDAFVACSLLKEVLEELTVTVVMTKDEEELHPLAAKALNELRSAMQEDLELLSVEAYLSREPSPIDVVLDGLYGHGFRPPLREPAAELLDHVNNRTDVLLRAAIDLPSGLGMESDPNGFVADVTYVPGVAKAPVFDPGNAGKVGRIRFLEIPPFLDPSLPETGGDLVVSPQAFKVLNQPRPVHSDKRDFGHCLVLAGSAQMPGAALMAVMGALQAGAGLVTALTPASVATQIASKVPEAMWQGLPLTPEGGLDVESVRHVARLAAKADALLIGPGMVLDRPTVFAISRIIRETALPLVLDASALTQDVVAAVIGRPQHFGPVVMTPHVGEFARLRGRDADFISSEELIQFSHKYRSLTLLKGTPTRISDGRHHILAPVGGPVLARGGSGDILSGMITALLARMRDDPLLALLCAVTWHGAAADALARDRGSIAVTTTELLPRMSDVLRA